MKTIIIDIWGYDIEVSYELTDDSIDIIDYAFESDEAADDCGFYSDNSRMRLEEEIVGKIAEYEAAQKASRNWIDRLYALRKKKI